MNNKSVIQALRAKVSGQLENAWYGHTGLTLVLRPLSWLFIVIATIRRFAYRYKLLRQTKLSVPVIIVGNITVGGTGKTPLVIWLASYLKKSGYKPGIISRGYGGLARHWPQQVRPDADPVMVGDEAVVISRRSQCPMAVGPDRLAAGQALLKYADVDVIISDDGLQHYRLARDIEIMVIDGIRRFGNGYCLPAGPLRERPSRRDEVDLIITNGIAAQDEYSMKYHGTRVINMVDEQVAELSEFKSKSVTAIAGIGNPDRFFNFLRTVGVRINAIAFPDHFHFTQDSLPSDDEQTVLMTEKDAVKCQRFAKPGWWYLPIDVELSEEFGLSVVNKLANKVDKSESHSG